MRIVPENNYIHIEPIVEEEASGNFQWAKQSADLTACKVITGHPFEEGETIIVISTMIQEFEFKKNKFKVCPTSAVIASIEEEQ
jgi:hypothetical protein